MRDEWFVIAGMTLATFLPRVVPLLLLPGMKLPKAAERWLALIAPAIIAALLLPDLMLDRSGAAPLLSVPNINLFAAAPAFAVALITRSMLGTVVAGIASAALLRFFLLT
jgi:branched-subunit amino acid transport protein